MWLGFNHIGEFNKTFDFLKSLKQRKIERILDKYGALGVEALSAATPKRTGLTAASWTYEINYTKESSTLTFKNLNVHNGLNVALLIQYGHGTGTGGWVQGIDYINPALKSVFDNLANEAFAEISRG